MIKLALINAFINILDIPQVILTDYAFKQNVIAEKALIKLKIIFFKLNLQLLHNNIMKDKMNIPTKIMISQSINKKY